MNKDLRKIAKALEAQGFEVNRLKSGHLEVRRNGRRVATFSGTPSDRRSWKNSLAAVRRHGFKWPPQR
jgi:predicted alpha/beta-hydrolase family hydrolase